MLSLQDVNSHCVLQVNVPRYRSNMPSGVQLFMLMS